MWFAITMFAYHWGWLAVTFPFDSFSLCLNAGLGAAVGWWLWKHRDNSPAINRRASMRSSRKSVLSHRGIKSEFEDIDGSVDVRMDLQSAL